MSDNFLPALRFPAFTRFYDPIVRFATREKLFKGLLIEQTGISSNETVVDIGCGTGTLAIDIKQRYSDSTVIGLDADPEILSIARRKADVAGVHVDFVQGYANDLPFTDSSVQRVVSSLFFHHLLKVQKSLAFDEILRILMPGGELHIADWDAPTNPLMRMLFFPVRVLDGFPNTLDNINGQLPEIIREAGAQQVRRRTQINTVFGTLSLFDARKS